MESGDEGYSISGFMVVTFRFENFRSGERTNFINSLLNSTGTMAPSTEVILQVSDMGGKIRILGADTAKSESLTVSDA